MESISDLGNGPALPQRPGVGVLRVRTVEASLSWISEYVDQAPRVEVKSQYLDPGEQDNPRTPENSAVKHTPQPSASGQGFPTGVD